MMNTREVADYLRIKERKVYDLVREGRIPCARVTGKWLFPKSLIDNWVAQNSSGADVVPKPAAPIIAGSQDPLLDWAVRESRCGLALLPGGSLDGLSRLAAGEATMAALHVLDQSGDYNVPLVQQAPLPRDVVVLEWAKREQGLVVAAGNPLGLREIGDLRTRKARVVMRQKEAGSQILFEHLLILAGIAPAALKTLPKPALSENDVGLAIVEGKADAGIAIRAVAQQFKLDFVKLHVERFDLVMRRRDYFEPPAQALFAFVRSPAFAARAAELGGYDAARIGAVIWNA